MKKMLFLLPFLAWGMLVLAKPRTWDELAQKAQEVLDTAGQKGSKRTKAALQVLDRRGGVAVLGRPDGGFAVMAVDDLFPAVMAYSHTPFNPETDNPGFLWWLNAVGQMTNTPMASPLRTVIPDADKYPEEMEPFLKTQWGQSAPFNNMCPRGCPTGCVATAAAQVIKYNQWPLEGKGMVYTYFPFADFDGKCYQADLDGVAYDYDNMLDRYDASLVVASNEQKREVAQLCYHVGLSMKAIYDMSGTGAYNETLCHGLRNHFGYPFAVTINSDDYDVEEWMDIIFGYLSQGVPLVYGGSDNTYSGHEFVLHGYNKKGLVSINWGWYGNEDGYFDLSSLLLYRGMYNFNYYQNMVVRCSPAWTQADTLDVVVDVPGTLRDVLTRQQMDSTICLRVKGAINSTDLKTLRGMAGRDSLGQATRGNLSMLDLAGARIVAGGEPYLLEDGKEWTTVDDEMPYMAFAGCAFLIDVTLPDNLVGYAGAVFANCNNLECVHLSPGEQSDFVVDERYVMNKAKDELIECLPGYDDDVDYVIPDGVKHVRDHAFAGRFLYERLTIPASVEKVGRYAFNRCYDLTHTYIFADQPPVVDVSAIDDLDLSLRKLHVPKGTRVRYKEAGGWKKYGSRIVEFDTSGLGDVIETMMTGADARPHDGFVYDLQGRRAGRSTEGLTPGIYVVGGRVKVVR